MSPVTTLPGRSVSLGVYHEIEKGPRRQQGAKDSAAQEPEESEDFDDNDGLDDSNLPDTEWDDE